VLDGVENTTEFIPQYENAFSPIDFKLLKVISSCKFVHPLNAEFPMMAVLVKDVSVLRFGQF
jgi:hypothetical protein